jgi:hypothetical protein
MAIVTDLGSIDRPSSRKCNVECELGIGGARYVANTFGAKGTGMRVVGAVALVASILLGAIVTIAGWTVRSRHPRGSIDAPSFRVPPGWYPDPTTDGCQRWWDGMTWTDQAVVNPPV